MLFAELSTDGGAQIVRLPAAFHLPGQRVKIHREGQRVVLEPAMPDSGVEETLTPSTAIDPRIARMLSVLGTFPDDFMADGRQQPPMPERDWSLFDQ